MSAFPTSTRWVGLIEPEGHLPRSRCSLPGSRTRGNGANLPQRTPAQRLPAPLPLRSRCTPEHVAAGAVGTLAAQFLAQSHRTSSNGAEERRFDRPQTGITSWME